MTMPRNRIRELRTVRGGDLKADPRNWRKHPKAQREALQAMLDRVGWADAVIARETPDGLVLIDGHLRADLDANAEVPVLVVDLDEAEAGQVLATLDPLAAMAEANTEALSKLLQEVTVPIDVGDLFPSLPGLAPELPPAPDDVVEPVADPITKRGDIWQLGRHRLMCGDATNAEDVLKLTGGQTPPLMVTDPPYGVAYDADWRNTALPTALADATRIGQISNDVDPSYWSESLETLTRWGGLPSVAYMWSPGGDHMLEFGRILQAYQYELRSQIIWAKQHLVISRGHYHWKHEPCWYGVRKGRTAHWIGDRRQTTVWDISNLNPFGGQDEAKTIHSAQKPVECMERPIRNHEGDVYDPFVGSGTTIIAAERQNRTCYAMEIDPGYVDAAVKRWETYTGEKGVRDGS